MCGDTDSGYVFFKVGLRFYSNVCNSHTPGNYIIAASLSVWMV